MKSNIFSGSTTAAPPARVGQNSPDTLSNGKTWANVVAGGGTHGSTSPTGLPRQPEHPGIPLQRFKYKVYRAIFCK